MEQLCLETFCPFKPHALPFSMVRTACLWRGPQLAGSVPSLRRSCTWLATAAQRRLGTNRWLCQQSIITRGRLWGGNGCVLTVCDCYLTCATLHVLTHCALGSWGRWESSGHRRTRPGTFTEMYYCLPVGIPLPFWTAFDLCVGTPTPLL